jgi:hypothetical protein
MPLGDVQDVVNESELSEPEDDKTIEVEFVPRVRDIGVARKTMMVVVMSLALVEPGSGNVSRGERTSC